MKKQPLRIDLRKVGYILIIIGSFVLYGVASSIEYYQETSSISLHMDIFWKGLLLGLAIMLVAYILIRSNKILERTRFFFRIRTKRTVKFEEMKIDKSYKRL